MKPYLQFALPSGHVFELATNVVANNRAAYYHSARPDEFPALGDALIDTHGLFADSYEIYDWLANNMDIDDVMQEHGRLIAYNPPALAWYSAERSFHDEPAAFTPIAPEKVFESPVELLVSEMASANEACAVRLFNGTEDGQPHQAIALFAGGPTVVNRYINALQITTDLLAKEIAATVGPTH